MANKRTDQLPQCPTPQPDYLVPMWNTDTGRTEKLRLETLIPSATTQNFEWVPDKDPPYQIDEVVTYGGQWYQSTIGPNTTVPGVDSSWTLLTKSSSGAFWKAGVYSEDYPFVYSHHNGRLEIYELVDPARPFNSVDLEDEIVAGDWILFGGVQVIEVDTTLVTDILTLDFDKSQKIYFRESDQITEAKTIALTSPIEGLHSFFRFSLNGAHAITFPVGVKIANPYNAMWEAPVWTAIEQGEYEMEITYINSEYRLKIHGPFN